MSDKYCRDFVAHSIHFLDYFHLKMIPLFNLLTKFVGSCQGDGTFQEYFPTAQSRFEEKKETKTLLERCSSFATEGTWLIHCQGICEKFDFFEWDDFFAPNLGKLIEATFFLEEKRNDILRSEPRLRIVLAEEHFKFDEGVEARRQIGLNQTESPSFTSMFEAHARQLGLYATDISLLNKPVNSFWQVEDWETRFVPGGMDLYNEGSQTDLDMQKFRHLQSRYPHYQRSAGRLAAIILGIGLLMASLFPTI